MKGYALLIGVDEVDENYYKSKKDLKSSFQDTLQMQILLSKTNLYDEIHVSNNETANWITIKNKLARLQNNVKQNDEETYVFLFFSGHGSSIKTDNNGTKEFLCFYDRLVSENEVQEQIALFEGKCKLFILINSCNSLGIAKPSIIIKNQNTSTVLLEIEPEKPSDNITIQEVYNNHNISINKILKEHEGKKYNSNADIIYFFASNEYEKVQAGSANENANPFTTSFISTWRLRNNKQVDNYYSFFQLLNLKVKNKAEILTIGKSISNFFSTTFPLTFNSINMMSPIQLYEKENQYVSFYLDNTVEEFRMLHSMTFDINPNDPIHRELLDRIRSFNDNTLLDEVKVMSLVFIELVNLPNQTNLPHPIRSLKTLEASTDYGIILTVDDELNILHKPKRTTGKVSNKLG